jgi:hypothetical protein
MKAKLSILSALTALALFGCSHQSANTRADDTAAASTSAQGGSGSQDDTSALGGSGSQDDMSAGEERNTPGEDANVVEKERKGREDAPTVYDREATGGSGSDGTVTTDDGQRWDTEEEPGLESEPSGEQNRVNEQEGPDGEPKGDDGL